MLSYRKLSGDHLGTTKGWSPDFLAKSLVIPAISLNFVYMAGITSDLAKRVVRTISTGTTLLVHTVVADFGTNWSCAI